MGAPLRVHLGVRVPLEILSSSVQVYALHSLMCQSEDIGKGRRAITPVPFQLPGA